MRDALSGVRRRDGAKCNPILRPPIFGQQVNNFRLNVVTGLCWRHPIRAYSVGVMASVHVKSGAVPAAPMERRRIPQVKNTE
jgi:hypothetical protein